MSPKQQPSDSQAEAIVSLAELVAMRRIPDNHAMPLRLYVGDSKAEMPLSEWDSLYREMMSKPTDMPKEQWHELFQKQNQ